MEQTLLAREVVPSEQQRASSDKASESDEEVDWAGSLDIFLFFAPLLREEGGGSAEGRRNFSTIRGKKGEKRGGGGRCRKMVGGILGEEGSLIFILEVQNRGLRTQEGEQIEDPELTLSPEMLCQWEHWTRKWRHKSLQPAL